MHKRRHSALVPRQTSCPDLPIAQKGTPLQIEAPLGSTQTSHLMMMKWLVSLTGRKEFPVTPPGFVLGVHIMTSVQTQESVLSLPRFPASSPPLVFCPSPQPTTPQLDLVFGCCYSCCTLTLQCLVSLCSAWDAPTINTSSSTNKQFSTPVHALLQTCIAMHDNSMGTTCRTQKSGRFTPPGIRHIFPSREKNHYLYPPPPPQTEDLCILFVYVLTYCCKSVRFVVNLPTHKCNLLMCRVVLVSLSDE